MILRAAESITIKAMRTNWRAIKTPSVKTHHIESILSNNNFQSRMCCGMLHENITL